MTKQAEISRRGLLKTAASVGVVAAFGGVAAAGTAAAATPKKSTEKDVKQYGFLVRTEKCTGCKQCVEACRKANNTPADMPARRKVIEYKRSDTTVARISSGCMHCEHPACMTVCPAKAISKGEGGVVVVDHDRCIGCKYCYQACPFEVPHYKPVTGMDKCDCCLEAGVPLGEKPNCVQACKFRALNFGPFDELKENANGRAVQVEGSTGPSYLLV